MEASTCHGANKKESLLLQVKKRVVRFKAGAELSGAVNLVVVDFNEEMQEDTETMELTLQVQTKYHAKESKS